MQLFSCGTDVEIKISKVKGVITAIEIRFQSIVYQVSWFNADGIVSCWLNESMFTTDSHHNLKIGFNK